MCDVVRRSDLDSFCKGEIDVEELARRHPNCGCEEATSSKGSPGPVQLDENVRLFLTSRSDIEGKRKAQREKRPFRALSLQKAFSNGLSVVRLWYADRDELEYTASLLHAFQSKRDSKHGGVLAVVDFPVKAVRDCADPEARMCVFETPLEKNGQASFKRPSHADVAHSLGGLPDHSKKAKRDIIYNQIIEHGIQKNAEDVEGCNLAQFLPRIVIDEGSPAA